MSSPLVTSREISELVGMPGYAVLRRLDALDDDLVIRLGRVRVVRREHLPEVINRIKRAPYIGRPRRSIAQAVAGRAI